MTEKIKLTPSELQAQAIEMKSLESEYTMLFGGVSSELNKINSNWSPNLAHNFAGKITSSNKNFAQITQELMNGAKFADSCAVTFETVDSQLAKMYGTDNTSSASTSSWNIVKEELSSIPENAKNAGEILTYLENQYGELPDEVKDLIKKACPNSLEEAYKLTSDLLQGKLSINNLYDVIDFVGGGSTKASAIIESFKYTFDKGIARDEKMKNNIIDQLMEGDVGGAIFDMSEGFVDIVGGGAIEVGFNLIGGTVDGVLGNIPFVGDVIKDLTGGQSVGDYISGAGDFLSTGLDTVTDVISDGVNFVTDEITNGLKSVGSFLGSLF